MAEVFISYKREDRPHAKRLAEALRRYDIDVWWDHDLEPGDAYRRVIQGKLESAAAVIVLWSNASVDSPFVLDEAGRGLKRGVLVPVTIDAVEPPLGFGQIHAADLVAWNGDAADARVRVIADRCATVSPAAQSAPRGAKFGRLSLGPSLGFAALWGLAAGVAIGAHDLTRGQPIGAPGVFWITNVVAGVAMVGVPVLLARGAFAAAQKLFRARPLGFFDPPFAALLALAYGAAAAASFAMHERQIVLTTCVMGAVFAFLLALGALAAATLARVAGLRRA